jgi:hypothetical protein
VFRGGYWYGPSNYVKYGSSGSSGGGLANESENRGFRLASAVPEPSSLKMLAGLALLASLHWRLRDNSTGVRFSKRLSLFVLGRPANCAKPQQ